MCVLRLWLSKAFSVVTDVAFKSLSDSEINYYVEHYKPLDKAGAYGIQEWIGYIGVTSIKGSYFMSWDYLYREYIKNYRNFDLPGMMGIYYEFCS